MADRLMNRFDAFLADKGLRYSRPREAVAEEFFRSQGHIGIEELFGRVRKGHPEVGIATVYRTLNLLVESGLALRRDFASTAVTYEKTPERHHDHLICTGCGRIVEFREDRVESLQEGVARRRGFRLTFHKMELYGLCRDCRRAEKGRKRR
jgi:Fur family ferric uptake transcriptional regulator